MWRILARGWDSGTPATIVQGLACGLTSVVSDILTYTEWITSGFNGLVVPGEDVDAVAEALIRPLGNDRLTSRFAERNVALAKAKAGYEKEVEKLKAIYRSLVDK